MQAVPAAERMMGACVLERLPVSTLLCLHAGSEAQAWLEVSLATVASLPQLACYEHAESMSILVGYHARTP